MTQRILAIACAVVGAVVGYFVFLWLSGQGFYSLVLPGSLAGLAGGIPRTRGLAAAVVIAVIALAAGLLAEHAVAPFIADRSLSFFLRHANDLRPVTLAMIAFGGVVGFYVPFRRKIA